MTHPFFPTWWGTVRHPPSLRYARPILAAGVPLERMIREGRGIPLDHAVNAHTRARRMGKNDRALLALAVYGFARNREGVLRALSGSSVPEGGALAVGLLDQIVPERQEDMELFPGVGDTLARLQSFRNEWAEILAASRERSLPDADGKVREALCALFSVPSFWLDLGPWRSVGEAASELARGRFPQKPQLRVNPSRASRGRVIEILSGEGIVGRPTERSPWGIVVDERAAITHSLVLTEGLAEIQDEGSQLVALACRDESAKRILDLCAGAGGKSLALSELFGRGAEIVAHDADVGRLSAGAPRISRSHAGNIRLVHDVNEVRVQGPYDLVLIDAPCSSTGTIRRNPDIAWRWRVEDLRAFSSKQRELMRLGRELTRPGGLLVYATCSLLTPENEAQLHEFLRDYPDCTAEALPPEIDGKAGEARLSMNLLRYDGDGFFIARMRKGASDRKHSSPSDRLMN